jgi:hypothetical protein
VSCKRSVVDGEAVWLERAFEESEVLEAPSLDDFSSAFFYYCWEVLNIDIMNVFYKFHARGKFKRSLNTSFIALIPMKAGTADVKDSNHINLVIGVYKIFFSVHVNRLKLVLEKVISRSHYAFIRGRQILDSVLIAK